MAKLRTVGEGKIEVKIGNDGLIVLREPTNKEWDDFQSQRYPMSRGGKLKDNSCAARTEFFDRLFFDIKNIEDDEGAITLETAKERISSRIKSETIFKAFESEETVEIKN